MSDLRKKTMEELNRLSLAELRDVERKNIWLVLDSVRSRNNVGSIFRTADAFRLGGIYLCGHTPKPPHRDIYKTALGATETVPWVYREDIPSLLDGLKGEANIWAVEQTHNSTMLQEFPKLSSNDKWVFIFGNEVSGVSDNALSYCEGSLEIPQWGHKHSLNISVSVGIVLWEVIRALNV